ncbi:MAG: LacI family DNA-binding transcriptional regulator [Ornithinimicrobium sp.]
MQRKSPSSDAVRPRSTMRQVAAQAGVSLKTVSRVVNNEPGVSPTLQRQVNEAVRQLAYRPNPAASNLRRIERRNHSVAVLLEDLANPFSATLLRAVEDVAHSHGAIVLAASVDADPDRERSLTDLFASRRVDGLVLMPATEEQGYLAQEVKSGTALVFVDRPPHGVSADCVLTMDKAGAAQAVRHLIDAGHRRIAFLTNSLLTYTSQQRYAGFIEALTEAGLTPDPRTVVDDLDDLRAADGATSVMLGLTDPPTAIFSAQNLVTIGAIRALRRLHQEHQVALVGFDDFPLAEMLIPAVTVIAQDPAVTGRTAARLLFERLAGDTSPARTHLVPTTLIRRGSGEIPPRDRGR